MQKKFLPSGLAILSLSIFAFGQQSSFVGSNNQSVPTDDSDQGLSTLIVNVELVNVPLTIRDNRGQMISNIDPAQLKLFEDEKLQTISFFSRETNLPLYIGILIDTSNSISERFTFETQTASNFLKNSVRKGHDQAFLMTFNSRISLLQDFTDDPGQLLKALERIHPWGATRLYDALIQACSSHLSPLEGRKVLIVISDGDDNASESGWRHVLRTAQNGDVTVYAISTHPHSRGKNLEKAEKIIARLADETGGCAFFPADSQEFASSFEAISQELRSQFLLAYRSSNPIRDGAFRNIKIETHRKDWNLKTKRGYYASVDSNSLMKSLRISEN